MAAFANFNIEKILLLVNNWNHFHQIWTQSRRSTWLLLLIVRTFASHNLQIMYSSECGMSNGWNANSRP